MAEFKKGDTVRLKSGGPTMTIQNLDHYGQIENGALCVWFERDQPQEKVFDIAVLEVHDGSVRASVIGPSKSRAPRPTSSFFPQG